MHPADSALPAPDGAAVADALATHWGITARAIDVAVGGADQAAAVWRVEHDGGPSGVKWTRRDVDAGAQLSAALHTDGLHVVAPRPTRRGEATLSFADGTLLVTPWVVGRTAILDGLEPERWHDLGAVLRRVHDSAVVPWPTAGRRRGIRRGEADLTASLARVRDALPSAWQHDVDRLLEAVDRADAELARPRHAAAPTVPCHGDPHLGNVVVDAADALWLIDFDEAVHAPREVDMVLTLLGVLFAWPVHTIERRAFLDGYGRDVALDRDRLLAYGAIRAAEDAARSILEVLDEALPEPVRRGAALVFEGIASDRGLLTLVEDAWAGHGPDPLRA